MRVNRRNEQPEWVPDWVWDEFQQAMKAPHLFTVSKSKRPDLSEADRDIAGRVIRDKNCACVWRAIGNRRGKTVAYPNNEHATRLLHIVKSAFCGPSALDVVTGAKRAGLGKKIASLAKDLQCAMAELKDLGDVPYEIQEAIAVPLQYAYGMRTPFRHNPSQADKIQGLNESIVSAQLYGIAREAFFGDASTNVLASLTTAAKVWATTEPLVHRNTDGAHVFFLKAVGAYFRTTYGTPLLEQVAALTNCLYETAFTKAEVSQRLKG